MVFSYGSKKKLSLLHQSSVDPELSIVLKPISFLQVADLLNELLILLL